MTAVDYTLLFNQRPHLWVSYAPQHAPLPWLILDSNLDDALYCRAPSFDAAHRFLRAQEASGDATVDERSLEHQLTFRNAFGNVRIPESGGRVPTAPNGAKADTSGPHPTPVTAAVPSELPTLPPEPRLRLVL